MRMTSKARLAALAVAGGLSLAAQLAVGQNAWDFAQNARTGAMDEQLVEARGSLERGRARKAEIATELASLGPARSALHANVKRRGEALYRLTRGGMLPIAGGFEALLGHAARVSRLERLVRDDVVALSALDRKGAALRKEAFELDSRTSAADREVQALEAARVGLAQQAASQRMFETAFNGAAAPPEQAMRYGLSVVGGIAAERFADQRGNLALPVSGPNMIRDASRAESDGPGLEMIASRGAAVRAAAAGRVSFAERYGSYGQIVILDHGDRFYTVYSGFGSVDVHVGDDVSKSARLGAASTEPIYFEVRRGTRTQDARGWLGL
jgi:septal ring factor EnvC (AmiA/AmiB activator)